MHSKKCKFCTTDLVEIINFGKMPIANGFVNNPKDRVGTFEQILSVCPSCLLVQLEEQPDEQQMFHENYAYISSLSQYMLKHFTESFELIKDKYLTGDNPLIVELGCNDGIFLRNAVRHNIRHLGFEPSLNVANRARDVGVEVTNEFFTQKNAARHVTELGNADVVYSANVFCHIPYIRDIIEGISEFLSQTGVFVFEDPYLLDIVKKTSYDQIYDEHAFYFSLNSVENMFSQYGFELIDAHPLKVHGGSMRYFLARKGEYTVQPAVTLLKKAEEDYGLNDVEQLLQFKGAVEQSRERLVSRLEEFKAKGQSVVGYGATSKSTTILNYCNIGPDLISFICDTSPTKQGKYTPHTEIPIVTPDHFSSPYPDTAVLFAWNHAREIWAKEKEFMAQGGQWLTHIDEDRL